MKQEVLVKGYNEGSLNVVTILSIGEPRQYLVLAIGTIGESIPTMVLQFTCSTETWLVKHKGTQRFIPPVQLWFCSLLAVPRRGVQQQVPFISSQTCRFTGNQLLGSTVVKLHRVLSSYSTSQHICTLVIIELQVAVIPILVILLITTPTFALLQEEDQNHKP